MSKLAPAGQDLFICLRCRHRLNLRQNTPANRRRLLAPTSHPNSHLRQFSSDARSRHEDGQQPRTDYVSSHTPSFSDGGNMVRPTRYRRCPPKTPLGMESMGEPAEVIVLHSPPQAARNLGVIFTEEPGKPLPTILEGSMDAFLDGMEKERGIIGLDQACENIDHHIKDAFRENHRETELPVRVSYDEFSELISKLLAGFEKKHLAEYWRRSSSTASPDALNLHFPYSSTLFSRSAWTPNVTTLDKARAPPLKVARENQVESTVGRLSLADRAKEWYARSIVEKVWMIHQEKGGCEWRVYYAFYRGCIYNYFWTITLANDIMKRFSKTYAVKFEASRKQNIVRIECDFVTSEDVLRMFIHILENIQSSGVSTGAAGASGHHTTTGSLDSAYIKEVERLTNTVIDARHAKQSQAATATPQDYIVYYLGPERDDFEDARRLLEVEPNANLGKPSGAVVLDLPMSSTASVIPVELGDSIPLMARSTSWARFGEASTRQAKTKKGSNLSSATKSSSTPLLGSVVNISRVTEFLQEPEVTAINERLKTRSYRYWEMKATYWFRVMLGQSVFSLQQAQRMEKRLKKPKPDTKHRDQTQESIRRIRRTFSTTVPGITRIVEAGTMSKRPTERLMIRMVAGSSPSLPSASLSHVPQLEIQINIHAEERTTTLAAARLVLRHNELDLLLPSHATDVRFVRRINLYADREEKDPRLKDFVDASNLDVWGSGRLRTPNNLQLSIPSCLIPDADGKDSLGDDDGLVQIDYNFASLEHKSDLNLPVLGTNRPQYTSVEAGRTRGRREELGIDLGPDMDSAFKKDAKGNQHLVNERRVRSLLEGTSSMIDIIESAS